jgi:outer membrane lipoprotein-sorting protein
VTATCGFALAAAAPAPAAAEPAADAGVADAGAPREDLSPEKLDALLADLARARRATKSLRASFTQERRIALLATTVTSKGALAFVAPDRLRWELFAPDDVTYWVGPEGLSYRTRSTRATVPPSGANVARALADLRALLTGDVKSLEQRYALSGARGTSDIELRGVARDPKASSVRAFTLVVDKELVRPLRARLVEGRSDTIDLVFANVQLDAPIDAASMRP